MKPKTLHTLSTKKGCLASLRTRHTVLYFFIASI